MFFDGEEAFMAWMATDSIYGARSISSVTSSLSSAHTFSPTFRFPRRYLPERWASTYLPPHPKRRVIHLNTHNSTLNNQAPSPPRPPRCTTPARAFLPPRRVGDTAWFFD